MFHFLNRFFSKTYFVAGIIGNDGIIREHKVINDEVKQFGHILTWKKDSTKRYRLFPDRIRQKGRKPFGLWVEGNPIQLELEYRTNGEQDIGLYIKSSQELEDVADNKITHDALRYSLSKLDFLHIALLIASIAVGAIALYESYQANVNESVIINYLNQLIQSHVLPPPSGVG